MSLSCKDLKIRKLIEENCKIFMYLCVCVLPFFFFFPIYKVMFFLNFVKFNFIMTTIKIKNKNTVAATNKLENKFPSLQVA